MDATTRRLGCVTLCSLLLLALHEPLQAQARQPRSSTNPDGGLRGAPTRGLATRGATQRGISDRPTQRARNPLVLEESNADGAPCPPGPTPPQPPAPAPAGKPGKPKAANRAPAVSRSQALAEAARLFDTGRFAEALWETDALLRLDPDDRDVLELLACSDVPLPIARPMSKEGVAILITFGTHASPSVQELAVLQLVDYGMRHRNELERQLQVHRSANDPARRAFGTRALRRLFPAGAVAP